MVNKTRLSRKDLEDMGKLDHQPGDCYRRDTPKTREQVELEAQQMNRWQKTISDAVKCSHCGGDGRAYAPLYGDPALGYADAGPCGWCNGTGKDTTKLFIS